MWDQDTWGRWEKEPSKINYVYWAQTRLRIYPLKGLNAGDEIFVISWNTKGVYVGGRLIVDQCGLTQSEALELKDTTGAPLIPRVVGVPASRYVSADPRYVADFQSRTLTAKQSSELWGIDASNEQVQLVDGQPGQRLRTPWKITADSASLL